MVLEKWLKPKKPKDQQQNALEPTMEASAEKAGNQQDTLLMLFDEAKLLEAFEGDADTAESILTLALEEIPQDVERLRGACQGDDLQAIRLQAHSIKGMAANLHTPALHMIAYKIETAAKESNVELTRNLLPELEQTMQMTLEAIRK